MYVTTGRGGFTTEFLFPIQTAHGNPNLVRYFADPGMAQSPQSALWLLKAAFANGGGVLSADGREFRQACLPGRQVDVSWYVLVNGSCEWHDQDSVGSRVSVPVIDGHDYDRPAALFGRVGGKIHKPDLTPKRDFWTDRDGSSSLREL